MLYIYNCDLWSQVPLPIYKTKCSKQSKDNAASYHLSILYILLKVVSINGPQQSHTWPCFQNWGPVSCSIAMHGTHLLPPLSQDL